MTLQLGDACVRHVYMVAAAAGEHDLQVGSVQSKISEQEVVDKAEQLHLDAGQHVLVRQPLGALHVVGVQVEYKVGALPLLLVHGGCVGKSVVCGGVVGVRRHLRDEERLQLAR